MKKRILAVLVTASLIMNMFAPNVFAADTSSATNNLSDKTTMNGELNLDDGATSPSEEPSSTEPADSSEASSEEGDQPNDDITDANDTTSNSGDSASNTTAPEENDEQNSDASLPSSDPLVQAPSLTATLNPRASSSPWIDGDIPYSTKDSYQVSTQPAFNGSSLVAVNTNKTPSDAPELSGLLPNIIEGELPSATLQGTPPLQDTPRIMGYDSSNRPLIDPASIIPNIYEPISDQKLDATRARNKIEWPNFYSVNSIKSLSLLTGSSYTNVSCHALYIGIYSTVWAPVSDTAFTQAQAKIIGDEFDSNYLSMVDAFGSPSPFDVDNDGKIAIACYDLESDGETNVNGGYIGGYFWSLDESSNGMDMIHIDSFQGMNRIGGIFNIDGSSSIDTLTHEFQHLINYAVAGRKNFVPSYLNEAFSESSSHLIYGPQTSRIAYFNSISQSESLLLSPIVWDSDLKSYSIAYFFGQYLRTQYGRGREGASIYKRILADKSGNYLQAAATALGVDIPTLLFNFWTAIAAKNSIGVYGFGGEAWADSIKWKAASTSSSVSLKPGGAVLRGTHKNFTPDAKAGKNIRFASISTELLKAVDVVVVANEGGAATSVNGSYLSGDTISLTATPNATHRFTGWTTTVGKFSSIKSQNTRFTVPVSESPIIITAQFAALPTDGTPISRALCLGINYAGFPVGDLSPAPGYDAASIQAMFENSSGIFAENVLLNSKNYTKAEILSSIKSVFSGSRPQDINYFSYSGHGGYNADGTSYLAIPSNTGFNAVSLSAVELEAAMSNIPGTFVLIIDCCYSGGLIGKGLTDSRANSDAFNEGFISAFANSSSGGSIAGNGNQSLTRDKFRVITASSKYEMSWQLDNFGNFTRALTQAAGVCDSITDYNEYPADDNADGRLSFDEIFAWTSRESGAYAPKYSSNVRMYPQYNPSTFLDYSQNTTAVEAAFSQPLVKSTVQDSGSIKFDFSFSSASAQKISFAIFEYLTTDSPQYYMQEALCTPSYTPNEFAEYLGVEGWTKTVDAQPGTNNVTMYFNGKSFSDTDPGVYDSLAVPYGSFFIRATTGTLDAKGIQQMPVLLPFTFSSQAIRDASINVTASNTPFNPTGGYEHKIDVNFSAFPINSAETAIGVIPCYFTVQIKNDEGKIVRTLALDKKCEIIYNDAHENEGLILVATNSFYWNGCNDQNEAVPSGTYTVDVTAQYGLDMVNATAPISIVQLVTDISVQAPSLTVSSNKTLALTANVLPDNATDNTVTWSLLTADGAPLPSTIAKISTNGLITAGNVSDFTPIVAVATANDSFLVSGRLTITIEPLAQDITLDKTEVALFLGGDISAADNKTTLTASVSPSGIFTDLTWVSSNPSVVTVENSVGVSGDAITITAHKNGVANITATTTDGSKKKATCVVNVSTRPNSIVISNKGAAQVSNIVAGKTLQLLAAVNPPESNQAVNWSLQDLGNRALDASIATISASGLLTTNSNLQNKSDIIVRATSLDGRVSGTNPICIVPLARALTLNQLVPPSSEGADDGRIINLGTRMQHVLSKSPDANKFTLAVSTSPDDATKAFSFTSSRNSVASVVVSSDGATAQVVAHKLGTATLTAIAKDGSGAKSTVQLVVVDTSVAAISVATKEGATFSSMSGGQSQTLVANVAPIASSNKTVEWELYASKPNDDVTIDTLMPDFDMPISSTIATISKTGVLSIKNNANIQPCDIFAVARASDGSGCYGAIPIAVYPSAKSANMLVNGTPASSYTLYLEDSANVPDGTLPRNTAVFSAAIAPQAASQKVTFSVIPEGANAVVGVVQGIESSPENEIMLIAKAPGRYTLTATTTDGTRKKASCVITVVQPVTTLSITSPTLDTARLFAGQALQLSAQFNPDSAAPTNKAVSWNLFLATNDDKADPNNPTIDLNRPCPPELASISSTGRITVKSTEMFSVDTPIFALATAKDGYGANAVYPFRALARLSDVNVSLVDSTSYVLVPSLTEHSSVRVLANVLLHGDNIKSIAWTTNEPSMITITPEPITEKEPAMEFFANISIAEGCDKIGAVNITATVTDEAGTVKKGVITLHVMKEAVNVNIITPPAKDTEVNYINKDKGTLKLKAQTSDENGVITNNPPVWDYDKQLSSAGTPCATINRVTGEVTAIKNGFICVTASVVSGVSLQGQLTYSTAKRTIVITGQNSYGKRSGPRLSATSLTVNQAEQYGTVLDIFPLTNETIESVSLCNADGTLYSKLTIALCIEKDCPEASCSPNQYRIKSSLADVQANGTQKPILIVKTQSDTYNYPLTIKLTNIYPAITIKAPKVNLLYPTQDYKFTANSKAGKVNIVSIANRANSTVSFTDAFKFDSEQQILSVLDHSYIKGSQASGVLWLKQDGYLLQSVNVNVPVHRTNPSFMPEISSYTFNTNAAAEGSTRLEFSVYDKSAPQDALEFTNAAQETNTTSKYSVGLARDTEGTEPSERLYFELLDKKAQSYKATTLVWQEGYQSAARVSMNIKVDTALPKLTLATTSIKLNALLTDATPVQYKLNADNLTISGITIVPINAAPNELLKWENNQLTALAASSIVNGRYQYKLTADVGSLKLAPVTLTITVSRTAPTVKPVATSLRLNTIAKDSPTTKLSIMSTDSGLTLNHDAIAKSLVPIGHSYTNILRYQNGIFTATVPNEYSIIKPGSYRFQYTPNVAGVASNLYRPQVLTVVVSNKAPTLKLKAKGSINVLDRAGSGIAYVLSLQNTESEITDATLSNLNHSSFVSSFDASSKTLIVRAKPDAQFVRGQRHIISLNITTRSGSTSYSFTSQNITITPTQPSQRVSATAQNNGIVYVGLSPNMLGSYESYALRAIPLPASEHVKLTSLTLVPSKLAVGFAITSSVDSSTGSGLVKLSLQPFNSASPIKPGLYSFSFDLFFDGQFVEPNNAQLKPVSRHKITVRVM